MRKYHIGKSSIHGKGVILDKDVKKDEVIFRFTGKSIENPPGPWHYGPNWLQIWYSEWIVPTPGSAGRYLNHSCSPSAGIKGRNTIVAMRPLKKGAEVVVDYALSETYPLWYLVCNCGSRNCRRVVKPYQDLSAQRKKKYVKYTSKYITDMKMHLSWQEYLKWKDKSNKKRRNKGSERRA